MPRSSPSLPACANSFDRGADFRASAEFNKPASTAGNWGLAPAPAPRDRLLPHSVTALDPALEERFRTLCALLGKGPVAILSGAGLSTEAGIPDYRDRDGQWKRARPVDHREFLHSQAVRRKYWARSFAGWPLIHSAHPARGHRAIAVLEDLGLVSAIITQNVDGLHQKAGSRAVIELHGGLHEVICLSCGERRSRAEVQGWMTDANRGLIDRQFIAAPDGDAVVAEAAYAAFRIPDCPACGGILKPDVVFFGDTVPKDRVRRGMAAVDAADSLLVVGSSLWVYSGFRMADYARQQGKPVAAINLGKTRADEFLETKIENDCGAVLQKLLARTRCQP